MLDMIAVVIKLSQINLGWPSANVIYQMFSKLK